MNTKKVETVPRQQSQSPLTGFSNRPCISLYHDCRRAVNEAPPVGPAKRAMRRLPNHYIMIPPRRQGRYARRKRAFKRPVSINQ